MRGIGLAAGLMLAMTAMAADQWELSGESSAGKHFVDHSSVVRDMAEQRFTAQTKVEQPDGSVWITTMQVDCKSSRFSYLQGYQIRNGQQVVRFDVPRAAEAINPGSLPDQLQQQYCMKKAAPVVKSPQWEVISNSNSGEVALDRASLQQSAAHELTVNARVKSFRNDEQMLSTLQLNCDQGTFRLLQAQKIHAGKTTPIFDKPQPSAPLAKSATAQQLAKAVCSPAGKQARNPFQEDSCKEILTELQALEGKVQADVDANALYCDAMQKYLDQLADIADKVEKNHCAIHNLDQYQRQIRAAGCEGSLDD
ncbi:hypothetical protein SAMN05192560_0949 [Methylobacillus rhizosphaerae]|uniref:Uncharacterized protein n=2 Tax=Methylobacillus rhizosphaerae TaxID=551994 RepID=A0A238YYY2_9PROT|nr:hypothetical protein SAMN05192560_0949 [Methylobacillus rhizosphaerae]